MEKLFVHLNTIAPLSSQLVDHLRSILVRKTFHKGEIILRKGQVCHRISFLESGLLHIFTREETKEFTAWILKEMAIFISVDSFFDQVPSLEFIQALEDCITWSISFKELEEARRLYPEFNLHYNTIKQFYYNFSTQRERLFKSSDTRQRYEYQMAKDADLILRTPVKIMASYLGMHYGTLNDIRNGKWKGK
jgi:CRP/FNR family transcriptional regulator, anaerobic regulatory protein